MNKKEQTLNRLIDLYFDGQTTLRQERRLRRMLAEPGLRSVEADEARAVLGVSLMAHRRPTQRILPVTFRRAAAILLVAATATAVYFGVNHTADVARSDCYAYVGNDLVRDPDQVMDMVRAQLADVSAAADMASIDMEKTIETFKQTEP